jgi:hypothetical protein
MTADDDYRQRLLHSIAKAEKCWAKHSAGCKGCVDCCGWGLSMHLAGLRVMLRKHDEHVAACEKGATK